MNAPAKKRLGELLVDAGIIDETQLKAALGHQRQWGVRLGQALVDLKIATEPEIVKVLARRFGFEVARLDQVEAYAHQQAVQLVPRDFAVKYNVFPLGADTSTLSVAMSDPSNLAVIDELRFRSGRRLKVSIGGDREVAAAIQAAYPSADGAVEAIALDIDELGDDNEPVLTGFGGGSSEQYDSFFGTDAAQPAAGAGDASDPFAAGPAEAPVAVPATSPGGETATVAAFPVSLESPFAAPPAPSPTAAPLPAGRPAQPAAPVRAPFPVAAPPAGAPAPGVRPATHPATAAARAPTSAAPTMPALRPAPATPASRPAPAPAAPAPQARPASTPRPRPGELDLEFPSADALRDARALRGAPGAPGATPAPAPAPAAAPAARAVAPAPGAQGLEDLEEELTPLSEDVEISTSLPLPGAPVLAATPPAAATPGEQAILDALERLADGGRAEPETLKPTQLMAALARLLLRKGILTERELLDALQRPAVD
jgi:hypothetical protein